MIVLLHIVATIQYMLSLCYQAIATTIINNNHCVIKSLQHQSNICYCCVIKLLQQQLNNSHCVIKSL